MQEDGRDEREADGATAAPRSSARGTAAITAAVLLLVLVLGLWFSTSRGRPAGTQEGAASSDGAVSALRAAPTFSGITFEGKPVSLEVYRGRPLLLIFWASW